MKSIQLNPLAAGQNLLAITTLSNLNSSDWLYKFVSGIRVQHNGSAANNTLSGTNVTTVLFQSNKVAFQGGVLSPALQPVFDQVTTKLLLHRQLSKHLLVV
jgi:hypothetical protein